MGSNQYGQLGTGEPFYERDQANSRRPLSRALPCLVEALQDRYIGDIAAGNDHCLALTQFGDHLFSWGQGKFGALGNGRSLNQREPQLVTFFQDTVIESIAAGSRHSAVITKDTKSLYTFGQAHHGQLGLGQEHSNKVFAPKLVELPDGQSAQQVALGDTHSLLLTN